MKNKYYIKNLIREEIEIEDIILDVSKESSEKMEDVFDVSNIKFLARVYFVALAILIFQAVNLQIIRGGDFSEISKNNYTRVVSVKAPRGIVYDNNMNQIVFNIPMFDLVAVPVDFLNENEEKIAQNLEKLSVIFGIDKETLENEITKNRKTYQSVPIAQNIKKEDALILEEKIKDIAGIKLEKSAIRDYVDSKYYSHVIGYSGNINEKELKDRQDYLLNDIIGKNGLELYYEKELRGTYGEQLVEVDSFGREVAVMNKEDPVSGQNLVLNVDSGLQKKAYDLLEETIKKVKVDAGSIVAMDPRSGAVLAMVSYPSYDGNLFANGISVSDYDKLRNDKSSPLLNRAIAGEYAPGSTFKLMMGSAALEERVISPTRIIDDRGVIYVGSAPFVGWAVLGSVDLVRAISMSSNIYFYEVGGGYGDIKGLGINKIKKYANLFGLGNTLGVDIIGERPGLIPDEEWKLKVKKEKWYIGDTYHVSIGQGDVLATPLQVASYVSVIASGGKLYRPQIVDKIIDSNGIDVKDIEPEMIRQHFISPENIEWIQKGMRENVISGSGRELADLPFNAAGKTGTAQYAGNKKTHAWYVAYAPYEDPEIVLAVIVEGGGEGHTTSVPIANELLRWYFENKKI
ncbi:MAG: penicillin-binding protein 2 [Candidatus Paceibacterota bacterium]|jgi:penicillin-binding protein 2